MSQEDILKLILNRADSANEKLNQLSERVAGQEVRLENIENVLKDGHTRFDIIEENCVKYRMSTSLELNNLKAKTSQLNGDMKKNVTLLKDTDFLLKMGKLIAWIIGPTGIGFIIYIFLHTILKSKG